MQLVDEIKLANTGILPGLVADYLKGAPALKHLYNYPPTLAGFEKAIADKLQQTLNRPLLVSVLKQQYSNIPLSSAVQANIDLLLNPATFTVTAAHQPALFLGPLYTVYKIASAVKLALQLKQQYPTYNFVPVYWMGSEDHDMEELNHTHIKGKRLQWTDGPSGAVGRIPVSFLQPCLNELKGIGVDEALLSAIEEGLQQYATVGHFTQFLVNELFKQHGLVVIDQDHKSLKEILVPVIKDELLHERAASELKDTVQFLQSNYKAQASPRSINFFYMGDGFRERIVKEESGEAYRVNNRHETFAVAELLMEAEQNPERFSPNVIYRPLYQEMILPNLAFVGGAGELSYWLELKPLFDYHQVNYPMLVMRDAAVLLPGNTYNKVQKLGIQPGRFFEDAEELIKQLVKQNATTDTTLTAEKEKINALFDELVAKAEALDATLRQSALGEKQKALTALENLSGKMLKAEKRKQETLVNQVWAVKDTFYPQGVLQERYDNFLSHYFPGWIDELVAVANPLAQSIKVLTL